jgi:anti-sigma factor RsiW
MTCDPWRDKLDAYVDGDASQGEIAGMSEHLRTCPSCASDALSRLQMKRLTQAAAARYSPSPEFRSRMEKSIQKNLRTNPTPGWAFAWLPRLVAVAALVLIIAFVALWTRHSAREQSLAELLDLHVATMASANPVDVISTDRHTVKPWFQGKLPFTFNLPELQNSPFKLVARSFYSIFGITRCLSLFCKTNRAWSLLNLGLRKLARWLSTLRPGAKADCDMSSSAMRVRLIFANSANCCGQRLVQDDS